MTGTVATLSTRSALAHEDQSCCLSNDEREIANGQQDGCCSLLKQMTEQASNTSA